MMLPGGVPPAAGGCGVSAVAGVPFAVGAAVA